MVERWITVLGFTLLLAAGPAQEPEFSATAPAKVRVPIESAATPVGETPTPQAAEKPVVPAPSTETAVATEAAADPAIADIAAEMDRQDAAETATKSTGAAPPSATAPLSSPVKTIGKSLVALCATLVLILLIFAALKRWGKRTPLLAGQQLARVIGRVGLSPQASLHFVQTNGEVLIIGVTQQHLSLLRTFDAADFEMAAETLATKATAALSDPAASFLAQLKETRASMGVEAAADEDLDQLKGELQRLKQYFQDSARARE